MSSVGNSTKNAGKANIKSFENPPIFPQPRWQGENINGGRLLIYSEQGVGDNIQFVRYAIALKQQGLDILVWNHSEIDDFLHFNLTKYGIGTAKLGVQVTFSHRIPMMSLPVLCGTTLSNVPYSAGYLTPSENAIRKWATKSPFSHHQRRKIGLAWQCPDRY